MWTASACASALLPRMITRFSSFFFEAPSEKLCEPVITAQFSENGSMTIVLEWTIALSPALRKKAAVEFALRPVGNVTGRHALGKQHFVRRRAAFRNALDVRGAHNMCAMRCNGSVRRLGDG